MGGVGDAGPRSMVMSKLLKVETFLCWPSLGPLGRQLQRRLLQVAKRSFTTSLGPVACGMSFHNPGCVGFNKASTAGGQCSLSQGDRGSEMSSDLGKDTVTLAKPWNQSLSGSLFLDPRTCF